LANIPVSASNLSGFLFYCLRHLIENEALKKSCGASGIVFPTIFVRGGCRESENAKNADVEQ